MKWWGKGNQTVDGRQAREILTTYKGVTLVGMDKKDCLQKSTIITRSTPNLLNHPCRPYHQTEEQPDNPTQEHQSKGRHAGANLQEYVSYRSRIPNIPVGCK